jgi:AGCS family alanine or glycine:cation symporter
MEWLASIVSTLNNYLWSYILIAMLIVLGLWFTVRTGFVQITWIKEMFRVILESPVGKEEGHISPFQAFCISTASRVGVGNIAGIAIAVVTGGPGAIFWMWVIATIGSATGFVESTLAQIYKVRKPSGGYLGGPAYYIKNVLGSPFFAAVFAVLISVTYGLIFNSVQANTIALSVNTSLGIPLWVTACAIAILTAMVIFGGMTRIARVVSIMVPFMAGAYLLLAIVVTVMNITEVPHVLYTIIANAFGFEQIGGGAIGVALMTGIKRGLFSNEAGMGAVPNAAAAAKTSHPVKQGLIQAMGVYFDTLFVCTASAMLVLLTPGWEGAGKTGIQLVQHQVSAQLGGWTNGFVTVIVLFFAFSSIIGNYFYGEMNMPFISKHRLGLQIFRVLVVAMTFIGSVASLSLVWDLADLFMALMALVNLVAITLLGKYAYAALKDYARQKEQGIAEPEFDAGCLPDQKGIHIWPVNGKMPAK